MSYKQHSEVDLGEFAEPDLCNDLSPEVLATVLTEADMNELLLNSAYQHNLDAKWTAPQVIEEPFSLSHDEVSFEIGTFDESNLFSNCESSDLNLNLTLLTNANRPTALACQPASSKLQYMTPSVLVSPASECSTAVAAATPMPRRRRRDSSCSSESASLASEASERTSVATPARARGGAKRRRGAGRSAMATVDKESDEYRRRRVRNNVAVRKSRDKAKQKQEETTRKVSEMARENENLSRQLESVTQELTLLRSIFANLGVPIQQLVTDALSTATQNLPRTGTNAAARAVSK